MKPRWIVAAFALLVIGVFAVSWRGGRAPEPARPSPAVPPKPVRPSSSPPPASSAPAPRVPHTSSIPSSEAPPPTSVPAEAPKPAGPWAAALIRLQEAAKAYEARRRDGEAQALPERDRFLRALQETLALPLGDSEEDEAAFQAALKLEAQLLDRDSLRTLADDLWNRSSEAAQLNAILLWAGLQGDRADPLLETRLKGEALAYLSQLMEKGSAGAIAKRLAVHALNQFLHLFPSDAAAVVAVSRGLAHADPESRGTAVITLGNVKSEAALAELKRLIREDPDGQVQSFAVWSLGNFPAEQAQDMLPELHKRMDLKDINATLTLAKFGEKAAAVPLIRMIEWYANDPYEGALVSSALYPLLDETSKAALAPLLKHEDPRVRANAAAALALAKDPAGQAVLWEALEKRQATPGGRLEQIAVVGLARLGDERVRPCLEDMAKSGDPRIRDSAVQALQLLPARP